PVPETYPSRGIFFCCCAWVRETEVKVKPIIKATIIILPIAACLLRFIAGCPERFSLPLIDRIWHSWPRATDRFPCPSRACLIAPSRFCLEHPWPYAFGCHRLSSSPARESH